MSYATTHTPRTKRHARIRARVSGTATKPRLAVYRSNRYVYAQLIDDENAVTLAAADSRQSKETGMVAQATAVGATMAQKAQALKIEKVVFDRGGFRYHGIVKALAEGAREGGLVF